MASSREKTMQYDDITAGSRSWAAPEFHLPFPPFMSPAVMVSNHLISRLRIDQAGIRRHDARGDVEILGLAVAGMWQRLGLDRSFNGVRRHTAILPAGMA